MRVAYFNKALGGKKMKKKTSLSWVTGYADKECHAMAQECQSADEVFDLIEKATLL